MTNSQGIATAPVFTANGTAGGPYTVTATVSGLAPANYLLTNTAVQTGPCAGIAPPSPAATPSRKAHGKRSMEATDTFWRIPRRALRGMHPWLCRARRTTRGTAGRLPPVLCKYREVRWESRRAGTAPHLISM
jgi:hypothetical protein